MTGERIERRDLNETGLAHVRNALSWGGPLSTLLARKDLTQGSVWAFLPDRIDDAAAHEFGSGGLFPIPDSSRIPLPGGGYMLPVPTGLVGRLAQFVDAYLVAGPNRLGVLEDPFRSADEPRAAESVDIQYFTVAGSVHYMVTRDHELMQTTVDILKLPPSVKYVGVLTELGRGDRDIESGSEISAAHLAAIAGAAQVIIVGAYDGEGYVLWSAA